MYGGRGRRGEMAAARHCGMKGKQVKTFGRQAIFDFPPIISARFALENAVVDQFGQAVRQNIAGNAELTEEFLEVLQPIEAGAQDHK